MTQSVMDIVNREGFFWGDSSQYFDDAERDIGSHWENIVGPLIDNFSYKTVLDLASGHGRNAQRLSDKASTVYCVDVNPENITFLRKRFADDARFVIVQNNGADLSFAQDNSIDLFYTFDAMVHFDIEIVQLYIKEAFRVTRSGGYAFIHCSNYTGNPGGDFRTSPHWRNFMSFELCMHIAIKAGFKVIKANKLSWGGIPELDSLFLFQKE